MEILIVKLSSIGDIIQTYRALSQIRFCYPQARITWAVEERFVDTVTHLKGVDAVMTFPFREAKNGNLKCLIKKLLEARKQTFDLVFDFQGNFKSALVTGMVTAKQKIGFDYKSVAEWPNLLVTNKKVAAPKSLMPQERNLRLVDAVTQGRRGALSPIYLLLEREKRESIDHWISPFKQGFILICPFSLWDQKTLSFEQWVVWIQKIRLDWAFHVVIPYFSPAEEEKAKQLEAQFSHVQGWKIESLRAWQYLMRRSRFVIAVDSASLHLAGVADVPTFSLFGPTLDRVYRPIGDKHASYQGKCPFGKSFDQKCRILRTCTAPCLKEVCLDALHMRLNAHLEHILEKEPLFV